jgi:hypothetical protein
LRSAGRSVPSQTPRNAVSEYFPSTTLRSRWPCTYFPHFTTPLNVSCLRVPRRYLHILPSLPHPCISSQNVSDCDYKPLPVGTTDTLRLISITVAKYDGITTQPCSGLALFCISLTPIYIQTLRVRGTADLLFRPTRMWVELRGLHS